MEGLTDADNFGIKWHEDLDVKVKCLNKFSSLEIRFFVNSRPKASVLAAVSSLTFCLLNLEVAEELYEDGGGEE